MVTYSDTRLTYLTLEQTLVQLIIKIVIFIWKLGTLPTCFCVYAVNFQ